MRARRVVTILLVPVAGVLLAYGIALALLAKDLPRAFFAERELSREWFPILDFASPEDVQLGALHGVDLGSRSMVFIQRAHGFECRSIPSIKSFHRYELGVLRTGWPLLAIENVWARSDASERMDLVSHRPLITALLGDAALWSAILFLGWGALGWTRRRRRQRLGRCPRCGYLRDGLAVDAPCPECGTIPS